MIEALKTIGSFNTDIDAELIRSKLTASGIEAFVFKDDCGGMRPHMQLTAGVKLKVAESDYDTAMTIVRYENLIPSAILAGEDWHRDEIRQCLTRSRGLILLGFAVIPALASFPIALFYSLNALKIYAEARINDKKLKHQILRIQLTALLFSIFSWGLVAYHYTRGQ